MSRFGGHILGAALPTVFAVLLLGAMATVAHAGDGATATGKVCTCTDGSGCVHFLKYPGVPIFDPCPCPCCAKDGTFCQARALPEDWHAACAAAKNLSCFLRRHSESWRLTCSEEYLKACCKWANWLNCPKCTGEKDGDPPADHLKKELDRETRLMGSRPVILMSDRFYLVCDIPKLTIAMSKGSPREFGTHEIAHIFLTRAEQAYRDFTDVFGTDLALNGRIGIFLAAAESTKKQIAATYQGNAVSTLLYGGGVVKAADGSFAGNIFVPCLQTDRDDDGLHAQVRHQLGHIFGACLRSFDQERNLPQWIYEGAAHWLCRSQKRLEDYAIFCGNETKAIARSGKGWFGKLQAACQTRGHRSFSEVMLISVQSKMDFQAHMQAWSYFEFGLAYEREKFVKAVRAIKDHAEARQAFLDSYEWTPENFDECWRQWVLTGKVPVKLAGRDADAGITQGELRKELVDILQATNADVRASMIRTISPVSDLLAAKVLVSLAGDPSDLVRETIALGLAATRSDEVLAYLRTEALDKARGVQKGYVVRVLGEAKDAASVDALIAALKDDFWLVRANAAQALARIAEPRAVAPITLALADGEAKVRMAAMDALAAFGSAATAGTPHVAQLLKDPAWQVRTSAADALAAIGSKDGITYLVDRLQEEAGRVAEDIGRALSALTGMTYGPDAERWKTWWDKYGPTFVGKPNVPAPIASDHDTRVVPVYYGIKIYSRNILFVLDVSGSMKDLIRWQKTEERVIIEGKEDRKQHTAGDKMGVAKEELADAIGKLDPRTMFNLLFFSSKVFPPWKSKFVEASDANRASAQARVRSIVPDGETNYHDTFKAVFGIDAEDTFDRTLLSTADTVLFLTDGSPTNGEITRTRELLAWFNDRNRFAKMRVHVIALGRSGMDLEFLSALAKDNQGTFVHIGGEE